MTLKQAQHIFNHDFLQQLQEIYINGNFGDIVMNPEAADIVEYFRKSNNNLIISVSTNGSARSKSFWHSLAKNKAQISFCLDGLEDTHHLYRQNTSWKTIIKNAKTFIQAGGDAKWKFIKFKHNIHQLEQCKNLSKQLGFKYFQVVDEGRNTAPVFDKNGTLKNVLGDYTGEKDFKILFHKKKNDLILLEDITTGKLPKKTVTCKAQQRKSIYIAANADVSPCCWTGFYPKTFGHGQYHQAVNAQLTTLIQKNNALQYSIKECTEWFTSITSKWAIDNYELGRLVVCDDVCGSNPIT
jgi:MoaA/NifB/PqqE/SkfB family radical SAM enzyme